MGIMNEDTLKFLTGYFLRSSYGEVLPKVPIFFLGAGIRLDIPPCHGLKVHFGMVLGCNGDGGKKEFKSGFVF